jgi:HlyD family secretion protein
MPLLLPAETGNSFKEKKMKSKKLWISIICILAVLLGAWQFFTSVESAGMKLDTVKVQADNLSTFITATGTVEPITQVEVSTQVSGKIEKLYVDFNDQVKKGQIIAQIDQTNLKSTLKNAEATLNSAETEVDYQQKSYNRTKALADKKLVSDTDLETAEYNLDNAKTAYQKAKLEYEIAKQNLDYTIIRSPIDGVVLSVDIEEGQTVAASLSAPTMFTIANDLTRMQVEADVDEADIGQVKKGQSVTFTVDAFPDDKFTGTVSQIRLNPTESSSVITYTVIVEAPNPESKLMPGMTASITVTTSEAENALTIPAAAARFTPDASFAEQYAQIVKNGKINRKGLQTTSENEKIVWVKRGNEISETKITTGIADGANVQVVSGLKEGDEVVTGITEQTAEAGGAAEGTQSSPFMPKGPGQKK